MLQNCLDLRLVQLSSVMIPLDKVYMLEADEKVDDKLVQNMLEHNYSKFPVYEKSKDNIIGFVKTKNFMEFDLANPMTIREGKIINEATFMSMRETLLDAIDILKNKKVNFGVVIDDSGKDRNNLKKCVGIITFKEIFEKIVLKKFKDNDIRVHIHLNKQVRIDSVMEAK